MRRAMRIVATFLFGGAAAASAQTVVPDNVSCARCRITVQDVLRLGPEGDIPTAPARVLLDARGRYWLLFSNEPAMIYGADGRFIQRLKQGEGPGEFRYPRTVLPVGDSMLVIDGANQRGTIMGPELQVGRMLQPSRAASSGFVLSWPDSVLVHNTMLTMDRNVAPYHIVSFAGAQPRVLRSFGARQGPPADARELSRLSFELFRTVAPANDGGFWATNARQYRIELWSTAGDLRRTLVRRPDWFPEAAPPRSPTTAPPPQVRAMQQDERGRLWVFNLVAAPTWREGYPQLGPDVREVPASAFAFEKIYHTMIEVLDPAAARVIARSRVQNYIVSPLPGGRAAIYQTSLIGEPVVRIVRLTLAER